MKIQLWKKTDEREVRIYHHCWKRTPLVKSILVKSDDFSEFTMVCDELSSGLLSYDTPLCSNFSMNMAMDGLNFVIVLPSSDHQIICESSKM